MLLPDLAKAAVAGKGWAMISCGGGKLNGTVQKLFLIPTVILHVMRKIPKCSETVGKQTKITIKRVVKGILSYPKVYSALILIFLNELFFLWISWVKLIPVMTDKVLPSGGGGMKVGR
jgi:hypothetical protein